VDEGRVNRDEIFPLLGPGKKQGAWRMAFCPVHADGQKHGGKAGYSLGLSDDGVLKCFAGCAFKDVLAALRQRAGVRTETKRTSEKRTQPSSRGDLQVEYEYRDAVSGELLAVKGRFEKRIAGQKPEKSFGWRLPKGTYGEGLGGRKLNTMPLWGAYELMNAPVDQRVWFAEGEKATEAIRKKGELAVCGGWGAGQRDDFGEAFEVLRGRDVILWPDNDVPGREYMAAVRAHLRDIAGSVVVVTAPVPPKGDAFEYFQMGGTVEALLADVVTKTTTDILGLDHFRVRVPTDAGVVSFEFEEVMKQGRDMNCELTVRHLAPDAEPEPYGQRINLLSQSARGQMETALRKQFDKDIKWTTVVSAAWAAVREAFTNQDRGIQIGSAPSMERLRFHIDTLFIDGQPNIVFGDGGSSKTYLCYAAGAHVAMGMQAFAGMQVRRPGGVLVFDYETGAASCRMRFGRILQGMGNDPLIVDELLSVLPIHYWDARGVPLADQIDALCRYVERHDISMVIIDSGADACGGRPQDEGFVLQYFNALSRLPATVTTVTICHVTTDTEGKAVTLRPFGSKFWHNRARRTWYVHRASEEESDEMDVGLQNRKTNDGAKPAPIALRVRFDGDSGPVTFAREEYRQVEAFEGELSVYERISVLLGRVGALGTSALAEQLGVKEPAVRAVLRRYEGRSFMRMQKGGGRGNAAVWGLKGNELL
jgi:hypothetical protein